MGTTSPPTPRSNTAARRCTCGVDATWLPTAEVERSGDALLGEFDALFMTTNFDDRPQGTLDAITYA